MLLWTVFLDIHSIVRQREFSFLTANRENNQQSKVKITQNDECILENEVRESINKYLSMIV